MRPPRVRAVSVVGVLGLLLAFGVWSTLQPAPPSSALPPLAPSRDGAAQQVLRFATLNADLTRRGPGLLLRDIERGDDPQIDALAQVLAAADADVLLLTKVDHDHGLVALRALARALAERGVDYPHVFALRPNSGMATGIDLDGNGRTGQPDDAQGFGGFAGAAGMAILSRHPIDAGGVRDFSSMLWRDLPGGQLPPGMTQAARDIQRLSSTGHWEVPVRHPGGVVRVLAFHASPPVFGGPGDRNRLRNHDEVRFWPLLFDGALMVAPPQAPFVLMGDANVDPMDGDGDRSAIRALLAHPAVQDPRPQGPGGVLAVGPRDAGHDGDPAQDTTHWPQDQGPGNLRVDYALPSADLSVRGAGVLWPAPDDPLADAVAAVSRHRLVWVDVALP